MKAATLSQRVSSNHIVKHFSKYFDLKLYFELVQKFKQSLPKINLDQISQFPIIKKTDNKIRIGFVSGDYGNHPVSYYLLNTINHISVEKFELIAYSNSNRMDEITLELKKRFNVWRKINHLNDTGVINLVRKDSVDILFDLSGHTAKNRLSIFVNKPAPVQVTWCGYNASTGLKEIDYIIGDQYVTPLESKNQFSENLRSAPPTPPSGPTAPPHCGVNSWGGVAPPQAISGGGEFCQNSPHSPPLWGGVYTHTLNPFPGSENL